MRVEGLHHLGEVAKRAGQPIDLVDHNHIDQSLVEISHQSLQGGTFHRSAREAAVVVSGFDQPPAFAGLAPDESFTCLALCMQRIKLLLQPFFRRLAGVNSAALNGPFILLHRGAPCAMT